MPTELHPAADSDASSRAAEVLDRLVRDRSADSSGRAGLTGAVGILRAGGWRRYVAVALVALAVLAVAVGVVAFRRPPPIEDRLPVADSAADAPADPAADPGGGSAASTTPGGTAPDTTGPTQLVVHVAGAVISPGVVQLPSVSRVVDAVSAAGGLRADADPDRVNLAAPLVDGQRVVVPVLGQPAPVEVAPAGEGGGGAGTGAAGGSAAGPIDLNTATAEQLDTLPGVGPATAAAIVGHRESEGAFSSVDSLLDVRGIGEAKLEALRDLVTVGGGS